MTRHRYTLFALAVIAVAAGCERTETIVFVDSRAPDPSVQEALPLPEPSCAAGRWSMLMASTSPATQLIGLDVNERCDALVVPRMDNDVVTTVPAGANITALAMVTNGGTVRWVTELLFGSYAGGVARAADNGAWSLVGAQDVAPIDGVTLWRHDEAGNEIVQSVFALPERTLLEATGDGDALLAGTLQGPAALAGIVLEPLATQSAFVVRMRTARAAAYGVQIHADAVEVVALAGDRFGGASLLARVSGHAVVGDVELDPSVAAQPALVRIGADGRVVRAELLDTRLDPRDVAVDALGNVAITGELRDAASLGGVDMATPQPGSFVAVLNDQGSVLWHHVLPNVLSSQVAVDYHLHVYVTGYHVVREVRFDDPANGHTQSFVHFDEHGRHVAGRGLDVSVRFLVAAPGGGIVFGGEASQSVDAGSGTLSMPEEAGGGVYVASLPPLLE